MLNVKLLIPVAVVAVVVFSALPSAAAAPVATADEVIAFERWGPNVSREIWVVNSDGSGQRKLADGCCLDWSPTGERLAYVASDSLFVVNVDGSGARRVTPRGDVKPDHTGHYSDPDWSSDGLKLVYLGPDGLYSVRVDGTERTRLTASNRFDTHPAWSADGSKIVFQRYGSLPVRVAIYVMNADGSGERLLVPRNGYEPVWAPNRPTVAFILFEGEGRHLSVINADGSGLRTLTRGPTSEGYPAWSPSGRKIAFYVSRDGSPRGDIHVVNRDGTRNRNLTRASRTDDYSPSWSPDGRRIAFKRSNQNDVNDIYVMTATGQRQTNITSWPKGTTIFDPTWSPARK